MIQRIRAWLAKRKRECELKNLFDKTHHLISRLSFGEDVEEELEKILQEVDKFWTGGE